MFTTIDRVRYVPRIYIILYADPRYRSVFAEPQISFAGGKQLEKEKKKAFKFMPKKNTI